VICTQNDFQFLTNVTDDGSINSVNQVQLSTQTQ